MITGILAIVIAFVGLAVIIAGVWGAVVLVTQKADTPVPLRYYAIVIGTIGIGVGPLGIAQALRILLLILAKVAKFRPEALGTPTPKSHRSRVFSVPAR